MTCTPQEFYCIRETAPAVIIKVSEAQLLQTSPQICRDGMNFIAGKYECDQASMSGTIAIGSTSAEFNQGMYSIAYLNWVGFAVVIVLLGIQLGFNYFKDL